MCVIGSRISDAGAHMQGRQLEMSKEPKDIMKERVSVLTSIEKVTFDLSIKHAVCVRCETEKTVIKVNCLIYYPTRHPIQGNICICASEWYQYYCMSCLQELMSESNRGYG